MSILQGAIYWADLGPTRGREQAGRRPALVLSTNSINQLLLTVLVMIGTGAEHLDGGRRYPTDLWVAAAESGLPKDSLHGSAIALHRPPAVGSVPRTTALVPADGSHGHRASDHGGPTTPSARTRHAPDPAPLTRASYPPGLVGRATHKSALGGGRAHVGPATSEAPADDAVRGAADRLRRGWPTSSLLVEANADTGCRPHAGLSTGVTFGPPVRRQKGGARRVRVGLPSRSTGHWNPHTGM